MITGWFVRLTLILAVLAVGAFDGLSVLVASYGVVSDAQSAAVAAAAAYQTNHTVDSAIAAAQGALSHGETLVPGSFRTAPDGTVSLQVRRKARSVVLHLWSTSAKWDIVTGTASDSPATS
jgi:hypothetical protein